MNIDPYIQSAALMDFRKAERSFLGVAAQFIFESAYAALATIIVLHDVSLFIAPYNPPQHAVSATQQKIAP